MNKESLPESEKEKKAMTIESLIQKGVLHFAKEPKANPQSLNFESYTVPLIEHDYPAKTPVMWNAVYEELDIPERNVMVVGNPKEIGGIFDALREDPKYLGGGAGVGFKDESISHLDELDPLAKEIGAVNFVMKTPEGKLKGFNTDGLGYAQSLEEVFRKRNEMLSGKKVVVLGAGGAGNAITFALAEKGARIVILNRTISKAEALAEKINQYFKLAGDAQVRFGGEDSVKEEVQDVDAVVNVSTKGTSGALEKYSALAPAKLLPTPENIEVNLQQAVEILKVIPKQAIISDIVLGKELTPFMKSAKDADFEILDGIPMVINQGVEAFWLLHNDVTEKKGITKEKIKSIMQKAASE